MIASSYLAYIASSDALRQPANSCGLSSLPWAMGTLALAFGTWGALI
jgi:hypothetical protein